MVDLGAETTSTDFSERPLEVSKDKFARSVLQNLNDAAYQASSKDIKYLVNCGNQIDNRMSITGEAPVHRAVLSKKKDDVDRKAALSEIISCNANLDTLDANGWTGLIHASYNGDLDAARTLITSGATVSTYSNQQK
jgi:ankyrin repeat protein